MALAPQQDEAGSKSVCLSGASTSLLRVAMARPRAMKRPAQSPRPRAVSVSEPELLNAQGDKRRKVLILPLGTSWDRLGLL